MEVYQPGDIIIARFPYQEDPAKFKVRPALVLSDEGGGKYRICKITKTNRTGKHPGDWVVAASIVGREMGLNEDSFIDLKRLITVPNSFIVHKISPTGEYTELNELLKKFNITV